MLREGGGLVQGDGGGSEKVTRQMTWFQVLN